MSQSQSSLNPGWQYVDSPTIHASNDTIIAGCLKSCYTGDSLAAARSTSAVDCVAAAKKTGEKRNIPEHVMRSIYKETVERLHPDTWSLIQQNDDRGKTAFGTAFRSRVQQYLDTGVPPDTRSGAARTKNLKLLTGSRRLPNCSATALTPARSRTDNPSSKARANIVRDGQDKFVEVKVRLPCSIKTFSVIYSDSSGLDILSGRGARPETVPMTFTGKGSWWKKRIVADSKDELKPCLEFELGRVAALPNGDARQLIEGDVEKNIANLFEAYLERDITMSASVLSDLEIQRKDHPPLTELSEWRIEGIPGGPRMRLEMKPVEGEEQSVPDNIMVAGPRGASHRR